MSSETCTIESRDRRLHVTVRSDNVGMLSYSISRDGVPVIEGGALGVTGTNIAPLTELQIVDVSPVEQIDGAYEIQTSKRRLNTYAANRRVLRMRNRDDRGYDLIVQAADDGVAFRYAFPNSSGKLLIIEEELTSFRFPQHAKRWLQPMAVAKSGWEQTNPSYEGHYVQGIPVGTPESTGTGWVYPALFQVDSVWVLITKAGLDGGYPGRDVVIARRAGQRWYIAGINGEPWEKEMELDLTLLGGGSNTVLITDGAAPGAFQVVGATLTNAHTVTMKPNGGFVMIINQ
ncbi:glycoside hydrolase family 97 N-terminal domain-containing protein [Parapedobacter deserti]|uniref:Glycoside hydrolase family 97 N-terminal domain-containing protein n=1 Tax=Parapedobacter deserti TaxID=1912957 RepID=A0ABV7JP00_9SPHI